MATESGLMWKHECRITHAIEYQWERECPYCGVKRIDERLRQDTHRKKKKEVRRDDED